MENTKIFEKKKAKNILRQHVEYQPEQNPKWFENHGPKSARKARPARVQLWLVDSMRRI